MGLTDVRLGGIWTDAYHAQLGWFLGRGGEGCVWMGRRKKTQGPLVPRGALGFFSSAGASPIRCRLSEWTYLFQIFFYPRFTVFHDFLLAELNILINSSEKS